MRSAGPKTIVAYRVDDLRDLPLIERKRRLAKLISRTKQWRAIQYNAHLKGNGASVCAHVCRMGLEGIVSKRTDAPYRSGLSKTWLRSKNPASAAVRRGRQESVTKSPDQSLYLSFGSSFRMRLGRR